MLAFFNCTFQTRELHDACISTRTYGCTEFVDRAVLAGLGLYATAGPHIPQYQYKTSGVRV
jgi:hypothetical protein